MSFKRTVTTPLAVVLLAAVSGCVSVEISSPGSLAGIEILGAGPDSDRCVVINNSGSFLFWWLPIGCGVPDSAEFSIDNAGQDHIKCKTVMFEDHAGMDDLYRGLARIADHFDRDLCDVIFTDTSTSSFSASYEGIVLGTVGVSENSVSAVLRKRYGDKEGKQ